MWGNRTAFSAAAHLGAQIYSKISQLRVFMWALQQSDHGIDAIVPLLQGLEQSHRSL